MAEHERYFCHSGFPHENIIRVPFLMYVPGSKPRTIEPQIQLTDVASTLFDVTGIDIPKQIEGLSFLSLLTGEEDSVRDYTFASHDPYWGMIRTNEWKLVKRGNIRDGGRIRTLQKPTDALYNLVDDPTELRNSNSDLKSKAIKNHLESVLDSFERGILAGKQVESLSETFELDEETTEHLKAVGYL